MTKIVTGHDVARMAGVSQATVSRALRNLPGTSDETRAAVLAAAAQLDYIPSDSGRVLSTRTTKRIALVAEELTNPFYPELVEPLHRHLGEAGLRAVLVTDTASGPVSAEIRVADLADNSYDGAILATTQRDSRLPRDLTERGIPHVLVNRVLDRPESPCCTVDNASGAMDVADLLTRLGHREIAAIHGPADTSTGRERADALKAGLKARGVALPRRFVRRAEFSHDAGMAAAHALLDQAPRPTAIVCGNDVLALGALSAARQLGLDVPDDLTVIGFDDIAIASWPLVALTTVHCDLNELTRTAVDLLLAEIREPGSAPTVLRVPVGLRLRGTHAAPRASSA